MIHEAANKKTGCEGEIRRCCSDGRVVWIRVRASIICVENMRTLLYLVMEDITPLAKERAQLKELRERLRAINPEAVAKFEQEYHL